MKRIVLAALALAALVLPASAQPVPPSGLRKVSTDTSLFGTGTASAPIGLMHCISTGQGLVWNNSTVAWECGSGGGATGTGTANTLAMWTSTTALGNSPLAYNGTDTLSTAAGLWGLSTISGTSAGTGLRAGNDTASTTSADTGWRVGIDRNAGVVYLDAKLGGTGTLVGRVGAGTSAGSTNSWLSVGGTGNVELLHNLALDGNATVGTTSANTITWNGVGASALDMGTHQIHNVTDPSSAQDAATKNYVDTATTNEITGTLTSGKVPVATGTNTLGDSIISTGTSSVTMSSAGTDTIAIGNGASDALNVVGSINISGANATQFTATTDVGTSGMLWAGGTSSNRAVYIGSGSNAYIAARYNSNSVQTLNINTVGYLGGTTMNRNTIIGDGKGNAVVSVTGSTSGTEFAGPVTADTTLGVTGVATLGVVTAAQATVSGSAEFDSHIFNKDTTNRPTIANCGTTPPTVVGTDASGFFTVASGATSSCAITFHAAYGSAIDCQAWTTGAVGVSTAEGLVTLTINTTGLTFTGSAGALAAGVVVHWRCGDH